MRNNWSNHNLIYTTSRSENIGNGDDDACFFSPARLKHPKGRLYAFVSLVCPIPQVVQSTNFSELSWLLFLRNFLLASMTLYTSVLPTNLWQLIYPFVNFSTHPIVLYFRNLSLMPPTPYVLTNDNYPLSQPEVKWAQSPNLNFQLLNFLLHSSFPTRCDP